jgi:3-hydroxybutyryl-CoA dehydratase
MNDLDVTTAPVTRTQIVRFAGAAGDFNPMHHDEVFARDAGQPSVFAMGQLQAAMLATAVCEWLGRENVLGYGVRLNGKVWPDDRLHLTGTVVEERDGVRRCELAAVRVGDGAPILTGWARARVPSSEAAPAAAG